MSGVEQNHEEVLLSRVPQTGMEVVVDVRWAADHGSGSKPAARQPAPDLQRRSQARALGGPDSLGSPEFAAAHPRQTLESAVATEQIRRYSQGIAAAIARAEQERDQLRIAQGRCAQRVEAFAGAIRGDGLAFRLAGAHLDSPGPGVTTIAFRGLCDGPSSDWFGGRLE
jgi:hypothetical protein